MHVQGQSGHASGPAGHYSPLALPQIWMRSLSPTSRSRTQGLAKQEHREVSIREFYYGLKKAQVLRYGIADATSKLMGLGFRVS